MNPHVTPISGQTYPAARAVAPRVHAHFARHLEAARQQGSARLATLPELGDIETVIDAAFWASLRREEGYVPRISLAFLNPGQATHPLMFERPLSLSAAGLARLAPAVERSGIHLGVWPDTGGLRVWGTTRTVPTFCFVLEVSAPGLLMPVSTSRPGSAPDEAKVPCRTPVVALGPRALQ